MEKIKLPGEMTNEGFTYVELKAKKKTLENGLEVFTIKEANDYYSIGDSFISYEKGKYSPYNL